MFAFIKAAQIAATPDVAAEFFAGYLYAIKGEDKRTDIDKCFKVDTQLDDILN